MKFICFTAGVVCITLCSIVGRAQTGSVTTTTQSRTEVQAGPGKASTETKQETNVEAQQSKGRAEAKTNVQSQNNASANAGNSNLKLDSGTQLQAVLKSTLDSKQAADGQQFLLKTTKDVKAGGQNVIKKGSTLVGHVLAAQSKAEGKGRSEMTLLIDGVQQGGQLIPLQAVFVGMMQQTAQATTDSDLSGAMPTMSAPQQRSGGGGLLGGGGLVGGATGAVNSTLGATTQTVSKVGNTTLGTTGTLSAVGGITNAGTINEPGQVLFSLQNGLTASSSGSVSGATEFTRVGKDIKLEKGTEFLLAVTSNSRAAASVTR